MEKTIINTHAQFSYDQVQEIYNLAFPAIGRNFTKTENNLVRMMTQRKENRRRAVNFLRAMQKPDLRVEAGMEDENRLGLIFNEEGKTRATAEQVVDDLVLVLDLMKKVRHTRFANGSLSMPDDGKLKFRKYKAGDRRGNNFDVFTQAADAFSVDEEDVDSTSISSSFSDALEEDTEDSDSLLNHGAAELPPSNDEGSLANGDEHANDEDETPEHDSAKEFEALTFLDASHWVIEELMLLANRSLAQLQKQYFPEWAVLRGHPAPGQQVDFLSGESLEDAQQAALPNVPLQVASMLKMKAFSTKTSKAMQKAFREIRLEYGPEVASVMSSLTKKFGFQAAKYFVPAGEGKIGRVGGAGRPFVHAGMELCLRLLVGLGVT